MKTFFILLCGFVYAAAPADSNAGQAATAGDDTAPATTPILAAVDPSEARIAFDRYLGEYSTQVAQGFLYHATKRVTAHRTGNIFISSSGFLTNSAGQSTSTPRGLVHTSVNCLADRVIGSPQDFPYIIMFRLSDVQDPKIHSFDPEDLVFQGDVVIHSARVYCRALPEGTFNKTISFMNNMPWLPPADEAAHYISPAPVLTDRFKTKQIFPLSPVAKHISLKSNFWAYYPAPKGMDCAVGRPDDSSPLAWLCGITPLIERQSHRKPTPCMVALHQYLSLLRLKHIEGMGLAPLVLDQHQRYTAEGRKETFLTFESISTYTQSLQIIEDSNVERLGGRQSTIHQLQYIMGLVNPLLFSDRDVLVALLQNMPNSLYKEYLLNWNAYYCWKRTDERIKVGIALELAEDELDVPVASHLMGKFVPKTRAQLRLDKKQYCQDAKVSVLPPKIPAEEIFLTLLHKQEIANSQKWA